MVFALLTLLAALALAGVAGWFSIIGVMAIYAGAPIHALIMGVVIELGKLITTSWVYRNWSYAGWRLKGPLIVFIVALMLITSIGVFGFLSKSHVEQGAKTIDNKPRVERLDQQIEREKSVIADNEKVIGQLDATINSYLGKDRADRSVVIRRSQDSQRKQLRTDIDEANKRIDGFNEEKFKLQSELRGLELEVGPIRYIAELIYGTENNSTKNIEGAIKIFTLLIVSTLDPLAIILLVAANHTIMRRQNEKKNSILPEDKNNDDSQPSTEVEHIEESSSSSNENLEESSDTSPDKSGEFTSEVQDTIPVEEKIILEEFRNPIKFHDSPIIRSPKLTRVEPVNIEPIEKVPLQETWTDLGGKLHFIPMKINEEEKLIPVEETSTTTVETETTHTENMEAISQVEQGIEENMGQMEKLTSPTEEISKQAYPNALSWLTEFRRLV